MGGCIIGAFICMGIIAVLGKEAQKKYDKLIAEGDTETLAFLKAYWLLNILFPFLGCYTVYEIVAYLLRN